MSMHSASELLSSVWRWKLLMKMVEHISRMWVGSRVSRSELLMNTYLVCELLSFVWVGENNYWWAEHVSSEWVALQSLSRSELLMRVAACPVCELLTGFWANQNHWWEWLNTLQTVSCSLVFEQIRTTDVNGWTCIQRVSYSVCADQNINENGQFAYSLWVSSSI
jgi:hypothetical protein